LLSFACFYYAKSIIGGVSIILITVLLTIIILIHIQNIEKAYVEIKQNEICVVDYYWGVKKEKHFSFSDITSAEICMGCSLKIKGYRFSFTGMRYIVFKKNKKYLFKIIYLPETERIFKGGKLLDTSEAEPVYSGVDKNPEFAGIHLKALGAVLSRSGKINEVVDINQVF
jgi:hypothetical protein